MSTQSLISNEVLKEQVKLIISEHIGEFIANYVNEHELKLKELSLIASGFALIAILTTMK